MIWHPVIEFQKVIEFKKRQMYGDTDASLSLVFPSSRWPRNRLVVELFQLTFSCNFDFTEFPFDSHECPLQYGDVVESQENLRLNVTLAVFDNITTTIGGDPIVLDNLPFPFEIQLVSLPNFEIINRQHGSFSWTGIVLKMRRNSLGQLLIGYFYLTASFALLSMISFLIKPDMVRPLL